MRLQKLGHACLVVEDGSARVLIDPGTFSTGFEELTVPERHPHHPSAPGSHRRRTIAGTAGVESRGDAVLR